MATAFSARHIGTDSDQQALMLNRIGYSTLEDLMNAAVPGHLRMAEIARSVIPAAASEAETLAELRALADANTVRRSLLGQGYYGTYTPSVIKRTILENPSWYTAYTPYQPEISQGRLEALLNFQTMVADLTGLHTANASMLDEGTAVAEAMLLARRASGQASNVFLVDADAFGQTLAVLAGRAEPLGIEIVTTDFQGELPEHFGAFIQYPGASGRIWDPSSVIEATKAQGGLAIVAADLLAMTLLRSPGEMGADIAAGTTQRFGIPLGFGGPHAGYLAVKEGLERQLPGRLIGVSKDAEGNPAYRLTLQTREQHIRRDKATSNICTAQVLLANMSAFYAMWHGPVGLRQIAERVHNFAARLHAATGNHADVVFDTVHIVIKDAIAIHEKAAAKGINFARVSDTEIRVAFDEETTEELFAQVLEILGVKDAAGEKIPSQFERTSKYLTHPVFNTNHSETGMMRYLRNLADKDLALDRTMIPLGSCTMKLNSVTEMEAVTWPEFASLHPFAPPEQTVGTRKLIKQLSEWLVAITGYDAVSLQPNAGSQGEFAGLLAIRNYHDSRGDQGRKICLIPSSAHGTNAASAVMAGMKVVVIDCDENGNVSVDDIKAKIAEHSDALAALMITYPSTHGVFETAVSQICELIHDAGGQVYVDGANLNALVGVSQPGKFGADVSHLNLHKTFAIPHGGGGPGVGPVIARAHLAPFLPNHPMDSLAGPATGPGPISAAPYGSASILPISWAYIRLLGGEGLTHSTQVAILSANYIAARLQDLYPVLYTGANGRVAHECILDIRGITKDSGVSVDDIAKRLMDYGFHAPTMSFPVAGTLMIEPTESEDISEIHRFIDAMISIRAEIQEIMDGRISVEASALRHAPHTALSVVTSNWDRGYSREKGGYPVLLDGLVAGESIGSRMKYWPPVSRIDGAHGDRNLVCACTPMDEYR